MSSSLGASDRDAGRGAGAGAGPGVGAAGTGVGAGAGSSRGSGGEGARMTVKGEGGGLAMGERSGGGGDGGGASGGGGGDGGAGGGGGGGASGGANAGCAPGDDTCPPISPSSAGVGEPCSTPGESITGVAGSTVTVPPAQAECSPRGLSCFSPFFLLLLFFRLPTYLPGQCGLRLTPERRPLPVETEAARILRIRAGR